MPTEEAVAEPKPTIIGQPKQSSAEPKERDTSGRFKPKEKASDETESVVESKDTPNPAVPEGVNPKDRDLAVKALLRDGTPQSVIDKMDATELVAWGLKRSSHQKDVDGYHAKIKSLEEEAAKYKAAISSSDDFDPIIKPFAETFGDDAATPLREIAKEILKRSNEKLEATLKKLQATERHQARQLLVEKYGLDDDARWQRVLARRASDKNEYDSERDALDAAARLEFSEEIIAGYEAKLSDRNKKRDNGQPSVDSRAARPKPRTKDDIETDIAKAIMEGDRDKAMKLSFAHRTA